MPTVRRTLITSCSLSAIALAPVAAVELDPALRIGGFVDAVGLLGVFDDNNGFGNTAFGPGDHIAPIFKALGELQIGGTVETDFSYQVDYELANDGLGGTSTRLEQAFARWQIDERLALTGGRFEDWIGLERNDSPTWYRTRLSPLAQLWHGIAETGANLAYRPLDSWKFNVYVVNGIWSETGIGATATTPSKESEDIGYGASAAWRRPDIGTFTFGGAYDAGTHLAQNSGGTLDTWSLFATIHYDALTEDTGFFCFADVQYVDYDEFAGYGVMAGAVQELSDIVSVGVAITYLEPNDDDALENVYNTQTVGIDASGTIGKFGHDDEMVEYCLSLLTKPKGSKNVLFNTELAWQDHALERGDVAWLDVQLIVVIP